MRERERVCVSERERVREREIRDGTESRNESEGGERGETTSLMFLKFDLPQENCIYSFGFALDRFMQNKSFADEVSSYELLCSLFLSLQHCLPKKYW